MQWTIWPVRKWIGGHTKSYFEESGTGLYWETGETINKKYEKTSEHKNKRGSDWLKAETNACKLDIDKIQGGRVWKQDKRLQKINTNKKPWNKLLF